MGYSNKRVSDPFNEKVRARLFGLSSSISSSRSSGSEHEGEYDLISPSASPCLSYLVQNFLENDPDDDDTAACRDCEFDIHSDESNPTALINDVIYPTLRNNADQFRNNLLAHVIKAVEIFSFFLKNNNTKVFFHTNLVSYLREIGYDAGVCKTKWASSGNLTAGSYEFIDIISPGNQDRYIIDTEFCAEFEIARESKNYEKLRSSLPRVVAIKPEEMKKIVKLMCDEARRSMKINGLTMPPWRKNRYMQMKWFGPYRRGISHFMQSSSVSSSTPSGFPVKCRAVGFDVVGDGERFLFPHVTRTR